MAKWFGKIKDTGCDILNDTNYILSDGIINAPDQNGNVNQLLAKPTMMLKPQFIPSALSFCFALGVAAST